MFGTRGRSLWQSFGLKRLILIILVAFKRQTTAHQCMKYLSSNNLQWLLFGFYRDALIVMLGQITRVPREYDDDFVSFGNRAANAVRDSSPRLERTLVSNDSNSFVGNLARRAALNMGEYMYAAETYLRLALKAQGQCRATLETLAVIKNPQPIAFVRQANIAHGPQQVNNGPAQPGEPSRAGKTEKQQNKTFGGGEWRTAGTQDGGRGKRS